MRLEDFFFYFCVYNLFNSTDYEFSNYRNQNSFD